MNPFRLLTPIRSAPKARERLHVLLDYERRVVNQTDLAKLLRDEIFVVVGRHVTFDPDKIQVREVHGAVVSTVVVDIEIPNAASVIPRAPGAMERRPHLP
jgi:cell division topological specificity factor